MTLSSLSFVFLFLPVFCLIYYLVPRRAGIVILFLGSLLFYAWGNPKNLLILLFVTLFNYGAGLEIAALKKGRRSTFLAMTTAVVGNIAVLAVYKYSSLSMPIGISFYIFSAISYLADVQMGKAKEESNPLYLAVYIAFFPKVTSGPIVRFSEMREQIRNPRISAPAAAAGLELFLVGLFKKILIADTLGAAFSSITGLGEMAAASAWLGMIFYSLQLYFDFSGYSDMAIGLARMLGFRFEKNFDYPYCSGNISEFWRRWHISLGAWFREYVYIPLGGNRCSAARQLVNLMAVWALTGIWHGSTFNFLFWGLYHGCLVLLDKFVLGNIFRAIPKWIAALITDLAVFIGWVFFFSPSLGSAFGYLGKMLGGDRLGFWNSGTSFILGQNLLLLILAVVLCTPLLRKLHDRLVFRIHPKGIFVLSFVCYGVLFVLSVAGMVSSTYSTFLYFQF
ncbi:MAG: MBOAT family O-acyltransferase [Lachnospiraceae bacterium]|nr:MBOAT family O-acyltransferase [Lachnospiraceae bacterium]